METVIMVNTTIRTLSADERRAWLTALGLIVRRCRRALGLSQHAFGERVGQSRQTINRIENVVGHDVPLLTLVALAHALNTTLDQFIAQVSAEAARILTGSSPC